MDVNNRSLYVLDLQPQLHREFFEGADLPPDIDVRVYRTYPRFVKGLQSKDAGSPNLLLFLPGGKLDPGKTRQLRLMKLESPIYIVTDRCEERAYLTYISMGVSGIITPPFNRGDIRGVLNGSREDGLLFPRNPELIREGQVRLDFLVPSKLSRILGVNRLVSFLSAEFGFPPEESRVNLPMVMDEALSNAIMHGNRCDENLRVHVRIYISSSRIVIQVEDQGDGFIPESVEDPRDRENIYKGSGRGVFLIKELMDSVVFRKGGRLIEMEKRNG
ncbi:MAG: ATP-binding protein [Candidatus Krumholzibacteria bacterium]|nr:ATP-binding protein [Candidatus Krumholzibacteria bacterium]